MSNLDFLTRCTQPERRKPCLSDGLVDNLSAQVNLLTTITGASSSDIIMYDTVSYDPVGMYNPMTGFFTIPKDGLYSLQGTLCANNFGSLPDLLSIVIGLNGTISPATATGGAKSAHGVYSPQQLFDSETVLWETRLNAGDTVGFFYLGTSTCDILGGSVSTPPADLTYASVRYLSP
jgi:hypothetical protein